MAAILSRTSRSRQRERNSTDQVEEPSFIIDKDEADFPLGTADIFDFRSDTASSQGDLNVNAGAGAGPLFRVSSPVRKGLVASGQNTPGLGRRLDLPSLGRKGSPTRSSPKKYGNVSTPTRRKDELSLLAAATTGLSRSPAKKASMPKIPIPRKAEDLRKLRLEKRQASLALAAQRAAAAGPPVPNLDDDTFIGDVDGDVASDTSSLIGDISLNDDGAHKHGLIGSAAPASGTTASDKIDGTTQVSSQPITSQKQAFSQSPQLRSSPLQRFQASSSPARQDGERGSMTSARSKQQPLQLPPIQVTAQEDAQDLPMGYIDFPKIVKFLADKFSCKLYERQAAFLSKICKLRPHGFHVDELQHLTAIVNHFVARISEDVDLLIPPLIVFIKGCSKPILPPFGSNYDESLLSTEQPSCVAFSGFKEEYRDSIKEFFNTISALVYFEKSTAISTVAAETFRHISGADYRPADPTANITASFVQLAMNREDPVSSMAVGTPRTPTTLKLQSLNAVKQPSLSSGINSSDSKGLGSQPLVPIAKKKKSGSVILSGDEQETHEINFLEESYVIKNLVKGLEATLHPTLRLTLIQTLRQLSQHPQSCKILLDNQVAVLLAKLLARSADFSFLFIVVEVLWNLLDCSESQLAAEQLSYAEPIANLRIAFDKYVERSACQRDKEVRNDLVVILILLLKKSASAVACFRDQKFLHRVISVVMDGASKKCGDKTSNSNETFEFQKLMLNIICLMTQDPESLEIIVAAHVPDFLLDHFRPTHPKLTGTVKDKRNADGSVVVVSHAQPAPPATIVVTNDATPAPGPTTIPSVRFHTACKWTHPQLQELQLQILRLLDLLAGKCNSELLSLRADRISLLSLNRLTAEVNRRQQHRPRIAAPSVQQQKPAIKQQAVSAPSGVTEPVVVAAVVSASAAIPAAVVAPVDPTKSAATTTISGTTTKMVLATLRLLVSLADEDATFREGLGKERAIHTALAILQTQFQSIAIWRNALLFCSTLCQDCPLNKDAFFSEGGVLVIMPFLKLKLADPAEEESFLLAVVECIWGAVCGNKDNEEAFLRNEGVFLLLDLVDATKSKVMQKHILGCLLDLILNPKALLHFKEWRCKNDEKRGITQLLISFWVAEEKAAGVPGEIVITNVEAPLRGPSYKDVKPGNEEYDPQASRAVMETDKNLRAKIFLMFNRLGDDTVNDKNLTTEERAKILLISRYLDFKIGEIWYDIDEELSFEQVRPVSPDLECIQAAKQAVVRKATILKQAQQLLLEEKRKLELEAERAFYRVYLKAHQNK